MKERIFTLIPYGGKPAAEVRPAYFLKLFGREIEMMRIISFGRCNFHCPYCKRDGQFVTDKGDIITAGRYKASEIFSLIQESLDKGERIRLSGGDPCVFIKDSMDIARFCAERGQKISIAHNGSSPKFVEMLLPYLDYAAIDLKAADGAEFNMRAGLRNGQGEKMLNNSLRVQEILSNKGVLVDVRTCVFSTTTLDDFLHIAEMVVKHGNVDNKFWTVRVYKPVSGIDWRPLPLETTMEYLDEVSRKFPELRMGLRTKWAPGGFMYWYNGGRIV